LQDSTTPWIFKDVIELQAFNFNTFQSHTERMSLLEDLAKAIEGGDATQVESLLAIDSIDVNERLPRSFKPPPTRARCAAVRCVRTGPISKSKTMGSAKRRFNLRSSMEVIFLQSCSSTPVLHSILRATETCAGSASKSTAAIQALLNRGVAVGQYRSKTNVTPLHSNAMQHPWCAERQAAANMLINVCGIDVNTRTVDGKTCLHIAAGHDAIRFFLDAGADVNVVDRKGQTPLHRVYRYECAVLLTGRWSKCERTGLIV
jgi:hypothetical protein